jgi:hypothetical protein
MVVIRKAIRHLQSGGALIVFPSGGVDPDPALLGGAITALRGWSESVEIFLRRVPETLLQISMVSGVLAKECLDHPLARLGRTLRHRQIIAEFIQIIQQMVNRQKYSLQPSITFSAAMDFMSKARQPSENVMQEIVEAAEAVLWQHLQSAAPMNDLPGAFNHAAIDG